MTDFVAGISVNLADDALQSAALGVNAAGKLTDLDIGKAVKLIGDSNYGLCADGNDIEGILFSVEPFTVNAGFGFGTVQTKERIIGINKNGAALAMAVGDFAVAAAQPAVGTTITEITSGTQSGVRPTHVKTGAGVLFKWRVISLLGAAGAVDSLVLLERV